jgi:hypothetical protein
VGEEVVDHGGRARARAWAWARARAWRIKDTPVQIMSGGEVEIKVRLFHIGI